MLSKMIFCIAVLLATLIVILLTVFSPVVHRKPAKNSTSPLMAFSMYLRQPQISNFNFHTVAPSDAKALIFRRTLTDGPENTSLVVGEAQGFIIPVEQFAESAFNVIYFTFDTDEYWGSLSVQAKSIGAKDGDELAVVGGTGSFAFARGLAVIQQIAPEGSASHVTYKIKLKLEFPEIVL